MQLLGPNKSVSNAFMILRMFQKELSEKRGRTAAMSAVVSKLKPKATDYRGQTASDVINGENDSFNKQLMKAAHALGADR